MARQYKDETGNKYGKWTVIRIADQKNSCGEVCWVCRCECGTEKIVSGKVLRRGKSKSCGCWKKIIHPGDKFGKLVALEKTQQKDNYNHYTWKCQCDCGNITYVRDTHLTSGNTKSCGCLSESRLQLLGKRFGILTVIGDAGNNDHGDSMWKCRCDCGNIKIIKGSNLVNGNTITCGCSKMSKGEISIKNILKTYSIPFKQEYVVTDLKNKRFDFAILNNEKIIRLIEFDGIQHFEEWNRGDDSLADRQKRDEEKNQWAKENNIPLVRIPYWELDNIDLEMLFSDKYIVK